MRKMKHITLEDLNLHKEKLVKLSYMTKTDIRNIWITVDEDKNVDLESIEYHWSIPLYQKMIFRFINCDMSVPQFFHQIDICNQGSMLYYFKFFAYDSRELVEFFAWIANGLGAYNICLLQFDKYDEELCQNSSFVKLWKENQITFFFGLNEKKQNDLIDQYNKEEVDAYNKMIK